jgi:hypothetical protein
MRRHLSLVALLLVLTTMLQACATARPPSVLGRFVKVLPRAGGQNVQGELLVAEPDCVVILGKDGIHDVAAPQIRQIRVRRHGFDGKKAWIWTLVGAAVSGVGLGAACSSVEDSGDCGVAGVAGAVPWLLFGGLSALATERSAFRSFDPDQTDRLRPFARYPQGLPSEVNLQSIVKPRVEKR